MKTPLLKLKVTPSFCFHFKITDDPTATIRYAGSNALHVAMRTRLEWCFGKKSLLSLSLLASTKKSTTGWKIFKAMTSAPWKWGILFITGMSEAGGHGGLCPSRFWPRPYYSIPPHQILVPTLQLAPQILKPSNIPAFICGHVTFSFVGRS